MDHVAVGAAAAPYKFAPGASAPKRKTTPGGQYLKRLLSDHVTRLPIRRCGDRAY